MRALPSGVSVVGLRLACNASRRDADGAYHERPNFFDVSVFGAAAESVERYLHKGSRIAIDGHLEWREWETAEQQRRQAVSVVAETVQFLDSPGAGNGRTEGHGEEGEGEGEQGDGQQDGELVGAGAGGDLAF